jgi:hypothetical protein
MSGTETDQVAQARERLEQKIDQDRARLDQRIIRDRGYLDTSLRVREDNGRQRLEALLTEERDREAQQNREARASLAQRIAEGRERLDEQTQGLDTEARERLEEQFSQIEEASLAEQQHKEESDREAREGSEASARGALAQEQQEQRLLEVRVLTRDEESRRGNLEREAADKRRRFEIAVNDWASNSFGNPPLWVTLEEYGLDEPFPRDLPPWAYPEEHFFLDNSNRSSSGSTDHNSSPSSSPDEPGRLMRAMRNELNGAFDRFYNHNITNLTERQLLRIYSALALVAGRDNPGLLIRYFEYYTSHHLRTYNWLEVSNHDYDGWDAITRNDSDTAINPRLVNLDTIELERLGSLLLHEALHTCDPPGFTGTFSLGVEGDNYAFEYVLGERTGNRWLQDYAATQIINARDGANVSFIQVARNYYETLRILYDIIDHDTSSRWTGYFPGLNSTRARELMTQYIFNAPENRSQDLRNITTWVENDTANNRGFYRLPGYN